MFKMDILCVKHPEVKNISFLMLLFAGIPSIWSFEYFIYPLKAKDIVKTLKQWRKSAGNLLFRSETSETLRNETVHDTYKKETINFLSVHVPKHSKPINDNQFGHYLAGLIDGDGHFSSEQELIIAFHLSDASLAYYVKKRLGFGSVKKVQDKNIFLLIIFSTKGIEKALNLINGKIRTMDKFNQIINNILSYDSYLEYRKTFELKLNLTKGPLALYNHWLAGFSDANASFQIKVVSDKNKKEIKLNFHIDQKKDTILLLIKNYLGGNISYVKNQDTYYYSSTSLGSAKKVIYYFDRFHLLSTKYINYLKWRKTYLIIQKKRALNLY